MASASALGQPPHNGHHPPRRGLGGQRFVLLDCHGQAEQSSTSALPDLRPSATDPRRDDAERLEAQLLEHPRRGGIVEEVRAFEARRGRASGRCRSAPRPASVAKPRPQCGGRSNSRARPRPMDAGPGRRRRSAAARRRSARRSGATAEPGRVGSRETPRRRAGDRARGRSPGCATIASSAIAAASAGASSGKAGPQQQSWRSREHHLFSSAAPPSGGR